MPLVSSLVDFPNGTNPSPLARPSALCFEADKAGEERQRADPGHPIRGAAENKIGEGVRSGAGDAKQEKQHHPWITGEAAQPCAEQAQQGGEE